MRFTLSLAVLVWAAAGCGLLRAADPGRVDALLGRQNLVAWCVVPFDASKRTPQARARMLQELGLTRCAYDWREEHVPTFEEEILQYQQHGIQMFAFWSEHDEAFRLFRKHKLHPQIWRMMAQPPGDSQGERVEAAATAMIPLARRTAELGCKLGLYNHGGWSGEPANLVAVCRRLHEQGFAHVGIVWNFHHGHDHIHDWRQVLAAMQPYLLCLNINGMNPDAQPKILSLGRGEHELEMLRAVVESDYQGPIGILDHRPELDAREALQENLDGLAQLREALKQAPADEQQTEAPADAGAAAGDSLTVPYDPQLVDRLAEEAAQHGDPLRGAAVFADARLACLSCHRVASHGGNVGPDLSQLGSQRPAAHLVESLFWPQREVKPEFVVWKVLTSDGAVHTGYARARDHRGLTLYDPATGQERVIAADDIEQELPAGTLMPDGLTARLSTRQKRDLIRFLQELGKADQVTQAAIEKTLAHAQRHGPAHFDYQRAPRRPEHWPNHVAHVNRDRIYDFYTKQAEFFRPLPVRPPLLGEFPGLDGGQLGHWGNQDEAVWADGRWNDTDLGTMLAGVFRGAGKTVPRAICVRLGEHQELSACFNVDMLSYEVIWRNGFLRLSEVRHGFMHGLQMDGEPVQPTSDSLAGSTAEPSQFLGVYRHGERVAFVYRRGDTEYLDMPWVADGKFVRDVAPLQEHRWRHIVQGGPSQWPQRLTTRIVPGSGRPYAVDTIELPFDNPWRALLFCSGHAFLPNGDALVSTMQGDVWQVSGLDGGATGEGVATWRRFASGLHQPLGIVIDGGAIFVQCRDQLVRLNDRNGDGEADFYECISTAFETSPAGHDFICGLERDRHGYFYTASGNQGLLRISPDGRRAEVLATGFRNPDGLGLLPDGTITVPCSEGEWTPASMVCAFRPQPAATAEEQRVPHFGYKGPRENRPPDLPLVYLPRGLDNSSGGQVFVDSSRWGPLEGKLVHLSFGAASHFLVLRDQVGQQQQGAVIPLVGDFRSGVHRGRFRPQDGQLYVTGMNGWGSYTPDDGCFQRVRYTGDAVQIPVAFHVYENGLTVRFAAAIDPDVAEQAGSHFAQCWNYRYGAAYGSPEYSPSHPGARGHDVLSIASAHVLDDGHTLFLELPELQPVNQLHLRLHVDQEDGHDLFVTVHALDHPFTEFPGYQPQEKIVAAHPILADLASAAQRVSNPWRRPIQGAREIRIEAGKNLTFATPRIEASAGEPLQITLHNPDVVPHNWALLRPGSLQRVGQLANRLIADPEAVVRHYIPETDDVLCYTDVVQPGESFSVFIHAPDEAGSYPFLCTFPGHWMVMNGALIVRAAD